MTNSKQTTTINFYGVQMTEIEITKFNKFIESKNIVMSKFVKSLKKEITTKWLSIYKQNVTFYNISQG